MWYDEADFEVDSDIASEFLHNDANFKVVLFQIDRVNTNYDDVYGESEVNEVRYHPPVELTVSQLNILPSEARNYDDTRSMLTYMDRGNLDFAVLTSDLKKLGIDLRRGDMIGYANTEDGLNYWSIYNDGRVNLDNQHTIYGIRPFWRSIQCVPVDPNQFNGL